MPELTSVRRYQRVLAIFYGIGAFLHLADLLDLRLQFSEMSPAFKAWIIFLATGDTAASLGLWYGRWWGVVAFVTIAVSQLLAYGLFFAEVEKQWFLLAFHAVTLLLYAILSAMQVRRSPT